MIFAIIHAYLRIHKKLNQVRNHAADFDDLHTNDPTAGKIKLLSDYTNEGLGSDDFESLYAELTSLLDTKHWRMLCDFYSKTADSAKSYTVWNTHFSKRGTSLYLHTNEEADISKKANCRTDMDPPLKARLGQANVEYLRTALERCMEMSDSFEQEAVRFLADDQFRATVDSGNDIRYQVAPVFAYFVVTLYLDHYNWRPLIATARHLTPVNRRICWNGEKDRPLMDIPNDDGLWDLAENPTNEQKDQVMTYYNMWHLSNYDGHCSGFASNNYDEFLGTLKQCNIAWRILQYGAVHPSFAGKVDKKEFPPNQSSRS
jgi:hypothetical protein